MTTKLTHAYVEEEFAKRNWCLVDVYQKNCIPMKCQCHHGHETTITWNNFKKGQGCSICSNNQLYDYEYVKNFFFNNGCELIDQEYKGSQSLLIYKCSCGNVSQTRFAQFKQGHRCQKCMSKNNSERFRHKAQDLINFCSSVGCELIGFDLVKGRTRIKYKCKCGNVSEAYFSNFKRYPNCKKCGSQKIAGDKCHMWNPDRDAIMMAKKYRKTCGRILRRALEATGQKKTDHTYVLLGYTSKALQEHIHNHPNYQDGVAMHIDHIFPIKAFLDHGIKDLRMINALDNLQPLPGCENLEKADNYDETKFLEWTKNILL